MCVKGDRVGGWRVEGRGAPELIEVLTFWWDGVKRVPADSQSAVRYCIQPASRSRALTPASHHSALFVSSFPPFFHSTQTPTHQLHTHTRARAHKHSHTLRTSQALLRNTSPRHTHKKKHPRKHISALCQPGNTSTNSRAVIWEKIAEAAKARRVRRRVR